YPNVSPKVHLLYPRGLSEESHQQLIDDVQQRLSDNVGMPIIFDILQYCADFILEHQHSSSLLCPICLCPMTAASVSVTPCDHYAHTVCFDKHTEYTRKQLGEKLMARDFKIWREQQASLMKIYERQKEKGGIIDLEEERKKNLITEDTVHDAESNQQNCLESGLQLYKYTN
ncbi:unnamed protein product, partial [Strongylus vulgaris]